MYYRVCYYFGTEKFFYTICVVDSIVFRFFVQIFEKANYTFVPVGVPAVWVAVVLADGGQALGGVAAPGQVHENRSWFFGVKAFKYFDSFCFFRNFFVNNSQEFVFCFKYCILISVVVDFKVI